MQRGGTIAGAGRRGKPVSALFTGPESVQCGLRIWILRRSLMPSCRQRGVGVEGHIDLHRRGAGELALAVQFENGSHVQRHRIAAQAQLVQRPGVVEQAALLPFILADEGVADVQDNAVEEGGLVENFRDGIGEPAGVAFKTGRVFNAAKRQAVEGAGDSHLVVVHQGRDVDDLRHLPAHEFGEEGFPPDAVALFSELQVAPDQVADEGGFIEGGFVITRLGAAGDPHAVGFGQFRRSRPAADQSGACPRR